MAHVFRAGTSASACDHSSDFPSGAKHLGQLAETVATEDALSTLPRIATDLTGRRQRSQVKQCSFNLETLGWMFVAPETTSLRRSAS